MRDIKFRVFDKRVGTGFTSQDDGHFYITSKGSIWDVNENVEVTESVIVMQYTGIKDRNGVEIYEGDIVTEHPGGIQFNEDDYVKREVKWGEFGWSPFVDVVGSKAHDFSGNLYEYIVIGNIYEKEERT